MQEEIQIIVIKRPYLGNGPDPREIIRLFSQGQTSSMASRMPEPGLSGLGGRRRRGTTWYLYGLLSLVCGVVAGYAVFFLFMKA